MPASSALTPARLALLVGLGLFALLSFLPALLNDGDTLMHIRAGERMLADGAVLRTDPFSLTRSGAPWLTHEWLAEIVLALVFRAAGLPGVMALTAASFALATALAARYAARQAGALPVLALIVLGFLIAAPNLLARPHILVLPLLVACVAEVLTAADQGRAPRWWIALLLWPAVNMHGSWLVAAMIAGLAGLEALLASGDRWRPVLTGWGRVGLLCGLATVVGPHGLDLPLFPFAHARNDELRNVGEWAPAPFDRLTPFHLHLAALAGLVLRGPGPAWPRLAALAILVVLSAQHERHQLLLGLFAPMLIAPALARYGAPAAGRAGRGWILAASGLAALVLGLRLILPQALVDGPSAPVTALAEVPASVAARPVFNDYAYGAYLIFKGLRPAIDSRAELHGPVRMAAYGRAVSDICALHTALKGLDADWTILAASNRGARMMDTMPGWRRFHADATAVVHLRESQTHEAPEGCPAE